METFDGTTYDPVHDYQRLNHQMGEAWRRMADGNWHTLAELARGNGSEAGVSARLRDFRKERFGAYIIERRREEGGLWRYRMLPPAPVPQLRLFA